MLENVDLLESLDNGLAEKGISPEKFAKLFRLVVGQNLADCRRVDLELLDDLSYTMQGSDLLLTESAILDTTLLLLANQGSNVPVSLENSMKIAKMRGLIPTRVTESPKLLEEINKYLGSDMDMGDVIDTEEPFDLSDMEDEDSEEPVVFTPEDPEEGMEEPEEVFEEEEIEEPKEEEVSEEPEEEDVSAIESYYAQYYNGIVQELLKRYSDLYASGYEVSKPAGVLTELGIVRVSGSTKVIFEDSVSTTATYSILKSKLDFKESASRSVARIASDIYSGYISDGLVTYFPNKHLEFAYGLCAPEGENQDSTNTYKRHADAAHWAKYLSGDLTKAVKLLVKKSTVLFVRNYSEKHEVSYKSKEVMLEIGNYLKYLQSCLSLSLLFSEYKVGDVDGDREVAAFKLRICDPEEKILNLDLTHAILQHAFMGGVGKVPFSYNPRVNMSTCIIEYAHEFNHDMAQATPLFAYKALESLKAQGMSLSFENLILGMAEDGSILRAGSEIVLSKHLTHFDIAGSQAGKGVMTLNILASGIASNKNIIYLDKKPDMSSLLKYLAPNMPVINGGDLQPGYDAFKQWSNMTLNNVPDEVIDAFGLTPSWNDLGDLVYMRLLKLSIGLLMVRGSSHTESCFGGEDGILLIVDEFSNFQKSFMSMVTHLTSSLPPITLEKAKKAVEENKMTEVEFKRVYSNKGYYALSYLNSLMSDMEYLAAKKDAGYDPMETARSDIFVIGQSLEKGMFNHGDFKDTFGNSSSSGRYKSIDANGLTKGSFALGDQSIPSNYVNFKTADAFFGRNMDDGRDKYLAQTSNNSKAKGRLDDKASNFAYLSNFSETVRKKIVSGTESDNIALANKSIYFKPFLILNSSNANDDCVLKMFERVRTNAGISNEELIRENPSYENPEKINEAIGFIDYIKASGIKDVSGILSKSAEPLNYIVQEILRYPGDWFQFVTDFSTEWLFTVKDIVDAVETGTCGLYNPITNPILREYVEFNPARFSGSYEDSTTESQRVMKDFFYTESSKEDFSNSAKVFEDANERMADVMGDNKSLNPDEEISFGDESDSFYQPLKETEVNESGIRNSEVFKSSSPESVLEVEQRVRDLLAKLEQLGYAGAEKVVPIMPLTETTEFTQEAFKDLSFNEEAEINSLAALMNLITTDVITKFGGPSRVTSFKVVGGSIAINGYFYSCKVKGENVQNIPYDIRKDLNAGNISKLFSYVTLKSMLNLRDLEFDSLGLAYDYVSSQLGFGNSISVDRFFSTFRSLQVLTIGKRKFERATYVEQSKGEDIFYKPRKSAELADAGEKLLSKFSSNSWKFTKDLATKKNCNLAFKIIGVPVLATVAATTGLAQVGSKSIRYVAKSVSEGIKDFSAGVKGLFNS